MKVRIFEPGLPQEKPILLKLNYDAATERIELDVVDEKGQVVYCGMLLTINKFGEFHLCTGVSKNIGLPTDDCGCIKITH